MRARYPDTEGFVERDGVRVAYDVYEGAEPTVLFAPLLALTHARSLKGVVPYLARHFRVVVVDGRGNGRSDRPREPEAYDSRELVGDCLAVMDATDTERAVPVSFSSRAVIGLRLCVEHPGRVIAAVFVTPDLWATAFYLDQLAGDGDDGDDAIFNFDVMRDDWRAFLERWARVLYPNPHSTKQIEDFVAFGTDTKAEAFIASIVGQGRLTREEALAMAARVDVPALVLQNGGGTVGPKEASDLLAEAAGAELRVFDGIGPLVHSRWPVAFNLALREYLEPLRPRAAASPQRASRAG